jgi:predicted lipoprotein with Yx(FWY)xxD motif
MAMRPTRWLVLVAAGAVALSACGSSSKTGTGASPTSPSTVAPSTTPVSAAASSSPAAFTASLQPTSLGTTLVDSKGMTLYAFKVDAKSKSNCNQGCDTTWPPLRPSGTTVKVGPGLDSGDFAIITRSDGTKQVTDYGAPLYNYAGDMKAGDTNGDGIGGVWYAVGKEGKAAKSAVSSSGSATTQAPTTTTALPGY